MPSSLRTEILAGVSSFLATAYIVVVNPAILSQAGMPFGAALTATVLVCFFGSLMMGLYARNPIVVAPGMGLNAFFTFTVVGGMKVPYPVALGAVFWAGVVFLLLSVFNVRVLIVRAIPRSLRHAVAAGIGLFITLIGLQNARFVVDSPATLLTFGRLSPALLVFVVGLALTAALTVRRVPGAVLLGILSTTALAATIGRGWGGEPLVVFPEKIATVPDFSLLLALDWAGSLRWALVPVIFAFVFTDLFDSLSTFVGLAEASGLVDEQGEPRRVKESLLTDAFATLGAGLLGSSPGTAYIESAVGIEAGGKTGLTAIMAAFLFLPCLFLSPVLGVIPALATAPALVLVGVFMVKSVLKIEWARLDEAIPAFLAMVLIPFTYSITQGIIWGFLSYTFLKIVVGKGREIPPMLWVIDAFALAALAVE